MQTPDAVSPMSLLQEELCDDPWKMLVACIMLNQTNFVQVRRVIFDFFERWPCPGALAAADQSEVAEMIRSLGFFNRRSRQLIKFSHEWITKDWRRPDELHGIGKYAMDSFRIFVERTLDVEPTDKKLLAYLEWAKEYAAER